MPGTVLGSEIMVGNEMGTAPGLKGAHILEGKVIQIKLNQVVKTL